MNQVKTAFYEADKRQSTLVLDHDLSGHGGPAGTFVHQTQL